MNIILTTLILTIASAFASTDTANIIYGQDNRVDMDQVRDWKAKIVAKSVASRIYKKSYQAHLNKIYFGKPVLLSTPAPYGANVCKDERFSMQPTLADCTGFLVGDDLLLTAGHCMVENMGEVVKNGNTQACQEFSWMFDYAVNDRKLQVNAIDESKMYNCKKVVYASLMPEGDFALIQLDRKVTGRTPLKLRKSGTVARGTDLFVIGNPSGLPLKYADGAKVLANHFNGFFSANLDTFGGNSGSPVFNARTYEVEGILVRGRTDYYKDETEPTACARVNHCDQNGFNCDVQEEDDLGAEHVNLLTKVLPYIK